MEFFLTIRADKTLLALAARVIDIGQQILAKENLVMATLQDIVDEVASETTVVAGLTTFIQGLQAQIAALPGVTPAMQSQIDGLFSAVSANTNSISAAMAINTPATPPPVSVPPVSP